MGRVIELLAATTASLVALLGAGTASAAALPVAETRVRASTSATAYVIGPHESVSAGQRWANAPPRAGSVAGCCVAAKSAPRLTATLDEVNAIVPDGETLGSWGQQIWGHGTEGARSLIGTRGADELTQIPGLTVDSARILRGFYQGAVDAGNGG